MNFAKFLRTPFIHNTSLQLLLIFAIMVALVRLGLIVCLRFVAVVVGVRRGVFRTQLNN